MNEKDSTLKADTIKEIAVVAAGEIVVFLITALVYGLLNRLTGKVWLGGAVGAVLAIINFTIMALSALKATQKATSGAPDVKGGAGAMKISYILRYVLIFGLLAVLAKTNVIDPVAAIVPLVAMMPLIILTEYIFGKAGGKQGGA